MNPWLWMLVGAGALSALSLAAVLVLEPGARTAAREIGELMLAAFALPWLWFFHAAPKRHPLSPRALEVFARQQRAGGDAAWLFAYRGRGLIIIRPNGPRPSNRSGVSARGHDAECVRPRLERRIDVRDDS